MASPDSTDLLIALGALVKRLRNRPLPEHAALHGVPFAPRHIAALLQIGQSAPIGMSELAEQMRVSIATMSQVVSDLESWELVERATDSTDRRRTLVSIAPKHRAAIRTIHEQRLRPLDRALRRLEPDERRTLIRGLEVLREELERTDASAKESAR